MACVCCGGEHDSLKCPLFGTPKEYIAKMLSGAPAPLARKPQPSLFEELYGQELGLLQDVTDDAENYEPDERGLALRVLSRGRLGELGQDDRARLDRIALGLAGVPRVRSHSPRPAPVRVRDEEEEDGPTGRPTATLDLPYRSLMDNDDNP